VNPTAAVIGKTSRVHSREFSGGFALRTSNYAHGFARPVSPSGVYFRWRDLLGQTEPLGPLELPVMALKHSKTAVTLAQAQDLAPSVLDYVRGLEHHLLHYRPDATTFGRCCGWPAAFWFIWMTCWR